MLTAATVEGGAAAAGPSAAGSSWDIVVRERESELNESKPVVERRLRSRRGHQCSSLRLLTNVHRSVEDRCRIYSTK